MTQFGYVEDQVLQGGQAAILQNVRVSNTCPQIIMHDNLTANIMLRGVVAHPCDVALYSVRFSGNIAVPLEKDATEETFSLRRWRNQTSYYRCCDTRRR